MASLTVIKSANPARIGNDIFVYCKHFIGGLAMSFKGGATSHALSLNGLPVHFKVSSANVQWSIWINITSLVNTRAAGVNWTYFVSKLMFTSERSHWQVSTYGSLEDSAMTCI